jgi:hypothetical protein
MEITDFHPFSYIDPLLKTAICSKIGWQLQENMPHLKKLKIKIAEILDSILVTISSGYRSYRATLSHQIMVEDAKKYGRVMQAVETVLPSPNRTPPVLPSDSEKEEEIDISGLFEQENASNPLLPVLSPESQEPSKEEQVFVSEQARIENSKELPLINEQVEEQVKSFEQEAQDLKEINLDLGDDATTMKSGDQEAGELEKLEENLDHLIGKEEQAEASERASKVSQEIEMPTFENSFKALLELENFDDLFQADPTIEARAQLYDLRINLIKNPGALAGFLAFLQVQIAQRNLNNVYQLLKAVVWGGEAIDLMPSEEDLQELVKETFGKSLQEASEVEEPFKALLELESFDELFKVDPKIEDAAQPFIKEREEKDALYHREQAQRAFATNLAKHPGALAGFLTFLQVQIAQRNFKNVYQALKAVFWDGKTMASIHSEEELQKLVEEAFEKPLQDANVKDLNEATSERTADEVEEKQRDDLKKSTSIQADSI